MFLLFGGGRGRRGGKFFVARIAILVVFLVIVFALHPHGTELDILQAVRVLLVVALLAVAWWGRRRSRVASAGKPD